jgi:IS5 family transposase
MMGRFKPKTLSSVYGDPLVRYARPKDQFLFRLDKAIDWEEFTQRFLSEYESKPCRGESPYHPLILFKTLLLTYLLNVSERAIEEQCMWCIPVRLHVGLGIHDAVPDHSTLTLFN